MISTLSSHCTPLPAGEYAELSKLSGMSGGGDDDVAGDEHALREVLKVVKTEVRVQYNVHFILRREARNR